MQRRDFHYDLPPELIAQEPPPQRAGSRLLVVDGESGNFLDRHFRELIRFLRKGDLFVFNNTRVVRARLFAKKESGGTVELLLERVLADDEPGAHRRFHEQGGSEVSSFSHAQQEKHNPGRCGLFQARASKTLREDGMLQLDGGGQARMLGRRGEMVELEFSEPVLDYLSKHGDIPLPPYIKREQGSSAEDSERYQTVFARVDGAVAAPTAGLHFDRAMLDALAEAGVESATVTLHVGAGTFQPIRVDDLDEHRMHSERVEVDEAVCAAVAATRARGGRIIAVGTTVVRSLESACRNGVLAPLRGETALFIRPGYRFQVIDALLTNFHLPESTLMMLVCAFGGMERMMEAYRHAVAERYRFFSYGDAMFVTPPAAAR